MPYWNPKFHRDIRAPSVQNGSVTRNQLFGGAGLVILVGLAFWSNGRRAALADVAAANDALRERIAAASRHDNSVSSPAGRTPGEIRRSHFMPGEIPWHRVAEWFAGEQDGAAQPRELARLRIALLDFTPDELAAELDRIDALDGSEAMRWLVGDILGTKDPHQMLDRFHAGFEDMRGLGRWQTRVAFENWAIREPDAASAWFDGKLAEGWLHTSALDGTRRNRIEFETLLIAARPDDPAVAARLARLRDDERERIFTSLPDHRVRAGTEIAWLRAIREQLPPDEQTRAAGRIASITLRRDANADIGSLLDEAGLDAGVKQQVLDDLNRSKP